jgi:hypothetical protein
MGEFYRAWAAAGVERRSNDRNAADSFPVK